MHGEAATSRLLNVLKCKYKVTLWDVNESLQKNGVMSIKCPLKIAGQVVDLLRRCRFALGVVGGAWRTPLDPGFHRDEGCGWDNDGSGMRAKNANRCHSESWGSVSSKHIRSPSRKQHHAQSPRTGMHNRWLIFPALPETQSSSSGNQPRSETDGPSTGAPS